jgi:HK97 family phage major capsid protein
MNTIELKEMRAKLVADARKVIDSADNDKRDLTSEESNKVDTLFADADKLEAKIDTQEKREAVEAAEGRLKVSERKVRPSAMHSPKDEPNFGEALRAWLCQGSRGYRITGDVLDNAARCGVELGGGLELSRRAMSKSNTTGPVQWTDFYNGFAEELKAYSPVLSLISYQNSDNGQTLPIPVVDDTANEAAILAEGGTSTAQDFAVTNVNLNAFKYESKEIVLSLELLQDSSINLEQYVSQAIATRFARRWSKDVTTGTGSGQPFGIVTRATASGVVATGTGAAPTLTADMLIDLSESLDDAYRFRPGVGYMMAPATMVKIRKLKDSAGQYLWSPSLTAGTPDVFNGHPVYRNMNMASTGVNAKIVVFGDFKQYLWRNVMGIEVYRLNELRILNGQVSFQAFARADGNLILPNAVKFLAAPAT